MFTCKKNSSYALIPLIALFCFFVSNKTHSRLTIVYNLRIAESTKYPPFHRIEQPHSIGILGFYHNRKARTGINYSAGGIFSTFAYVNSNYYARAYFAFGHVKQSKWNTCFSKSKLTKTETDDILLTAGYSFVNKKRVKLTFSGILGLPTHNDAGLEEVQFGLAHVSVGCQFDGSFLYSRYKKHSIRAAARYIYFIPRETYITLDKQFGRFKYSLGSLIDILIAHYQVYDNHSFELGINETFLVGSTLKPVIASVARLIPFIRNSFYTVYKYRFPLRHLHSAAAIAFSYGFDIKPKEAGYKRIITAWALWGISF